MHLIFHRLLAIIISIIIIMAPFTWRHESALNFFASTFQYLNQCTFYVDLPQYLSPPLVTGDDLRPDMLISFPSNTLYVLELSVGFETNLDNNASRKFTKYRYLLNDLTSKCRHVKFELVNRFPWNLWTILRFVHSDV